MLLYQRVSITIREERPEDIAAIREVNKRAFGQDQEANLVDALRSNGAGLLSLVAKIDGEVVGHIMYSPATIDEEVTNAPVNHVDPAVTQVSGAGLAPMAVLPEHQRHGIGSQLIKAGNRKIKDAGFPFIIVLGHSDYYPRFGFQPANTLGIRCEWDVPPEVFMILILDQAKMHGISGLAKYRHEFGSDT